MPSGSNRFLRSVVCGVCQNPVQNSGHDQSDSPRDTPYARFQRQVLNWLAHWVTLFVTPTSILRLVFEMGPEMFRIACLKMLLPFCCAVIVLLGALVPADAIERPQWVVRCGGLYALCGYVDRDTEKEIIPKRFERAMLFSEGLAPVRLDGRFGFIDRSGNVVIKPAFDLAGRFHRGQAEVIVQGKAGVIDRSGKFVIEPGFSRAVPFNGEIVLAKEGDWRDRHIRGHRKLERLIDMSVSGHHPYGLYHVDDGWIVQPSLELTRFDDGETGLIWARKYGDRDAPWGLLRADGTWKIEPAFKRVSWLTEERAVVYGFDGLAGAVDRSGAIVIPMKFKSLNGWRSGFSRVGDGQKEGLLLPDGTLVADRHFDEVQADYFTGVKPRVRDGDTWKTVLPDGSLVKDELENAIYLQCPSGLTFRHRGGKLAIEKGDGSAVSDTLFDFTWMFQRDCAEPISIKHNDRWGFVTQDGRLITEPLTFENQFGFSGGYAGVSLDGKWGVIAKDGRFTIAPTFDELRMAGEGVFQVTLNEKVSWVDPNGQQVPKPDRREVDRKTILECVGGGVLFRLDGRWGMRGPDGAILIEPAHRALDCYTQGVAWATRDDMKRWCPIGQDGDWQDAPSCVEEHNFVWISHHGPEKFADDAYESSVEWMIAFLEYGEGIRNQPPKFVGGGYGRHSEIPIDKRYDIRRIRNR